MACMCSWDVCLLSILRTEPKPRSRRLVEANAWTLSSSYETVARPSGLQRFLYQTTQTDRHESDLRLVTAVTRCWLDRLALLCTRDMDFELPFRNGLTAARPPASEDSNSLKATGRSYSSSSSTPGPSRSRLYRCPPRDRPLYSVKGYTIQIHATDADHSYWPVLADSNDPNVSSWHQPVSAEDPIYATWNSRLAKALVKSLDLGDPSKDWLLASWPEGYRMFRRHDRQGGDDPALQYVWSESMDLHDLCQTS